MPNNWQVIRPTGNLTVGGGNLTIPLAATDLYQTTNNQGDIVLRSLPSGAFEATTKVTVAGAKKGYQQGGLIIYGDDNNYMKLVYSGRSTATAGDKAANIIQMTKETNATAAESNSANLGAAFPDTVWLRLASTDGVAVTGSYSTDGITYTPLTLANGNAAPTRDFTGITAPRVGLIALASTTAGAADNLVAQFDSFEMKSTADCLPTATDTTAPTTTLTIPAANAAGWYTTRPSFTLAATDNTGGSGVASSEYRIDGGAWTPYTAAVSVTGEGTKVIDYRSKDVAGNTETFKSQTVKIDTVIPTVSAVEAGPAGGPKTLTLTATDATSGVARIEYQKDAETAWTTYTAPVSVSSTGSTVVRYRAVDVAGNTSAVGTSTVEVSDTTAPAVGATVLGSYAGALVDQASTGITGSATMVSEAVTGGGYTTTLNLDLAGLSTTERYESHLHIGTTCGGFAGHYRNDPAGDGVPPNELWPTNPGWTAGSGDPRIKAASDGTSHAEATVAWAPRIEGGILALHRDGAIIGCVDLDLAGPGTVVLDATDNVGVTSVEYRLDGGAWTAYDDPFVVATPGSHTVDWRASDAAGNTTNGSFPVVVPQVDNGAPVATATVSAPDGLRGWHHDPATVTLTVDGGHR